MLEHKHTELFWHFQILVQEKLINPSQDTFIQRALAGVYPSTFH
jgi:hypothetical protein